MSRDIGAMRVLDMEIQVERPTHNAEGWSKGTRASTWSRNSLIRWSQELRDLAYRRWLRRRLAFDRAERNAITLEQCRELSVPTGAEGQFEER